MPPTFPCRPVCYGGAVFPYNVDAIKLSRCPQYAQCMYQSACAGWEQFSCRRCPAAKGLLNYKLDELFPLVYWARHLDVSLRALRKRFDRVANRIPYERDSDGTRYVSLIVAGWLCPKKMPGYTVALATKREANTDAPAMC
ncbi:MAG: hypothetical protein V2A77_00785 [Pseudomonadota bacterium]